MTPLTPEIIAAFVKLMPAAQLQEPLAAHTTFRLGGPARIFLTVTTIDALVRALSVAHELKLPWQILGGGTNTLVSEVGYEGLVLHVAATEIRIEKSEVIVDAGSASVLVARKTVEVGLQGLEWAVGLPGTIGGAIYGNAGCYGGEIKDCLRSVEVWDPRQQTVKQLSVAECRMSYRDSLFKHKKYVILRGIFGLTRLRDVSTLHTKMKDILEHRRVEQPLGTSSAGCAFTNVDQITASDVEILQRAVDVPQEFLQKHRIPAGWLIEQAGLKGMRVGAFRVSERHANFLLHEGQGRVDDVLALMSIIKMRIRDMYGIQLHEEVQLMGFE